MLKYTGSLRVLCVHLFDGLLENNLGDISLDLKRWSDKVIVN